MKEINIKPRCTFDLNKRVQFNSSEIDYIIKICNILDKFERSLKNE